MADKKVPKKMRDTQEQDYITNKILAVFSLCLFGIMALWYVSSLLRSNRFMLGLRILDVSRWVGVVLVIGSLLLLVYDRKAGRSGKRLLSGRNLLVVTVLFTMMAIVVDRDPVRMIKVFYGVLPALAIYYLIYFSYQPEFFVVATDVGVGAALLLGIRLSQGGMIAYVAAALAVVLAIVQLAGAGKRLRGSSLPAGFGPKAHLVVSVTAVLMAAMVVLGAVMGPAHVFYLLCISAAYVFILAVYYTVKLM